MADQDWVVIGIVPGDLQAEILRGFLEAQGIPVLLSQEGAGRAIGLSVGPLGEVEILVPEQNQLEATRLLADYHAGLFETDEELKDWDSPETEN